MTTPAEARAARDARLAKSRDKIQDLYAAVGATVSYEYTANGRHIDLGTELSVSGEGSTRFRFVKHVRTAAGVEWIDCLESGGGFRSFRPDRIKTVHRITKTRENAA